MVYWLEVDVAVGRQAAVVDGRWSMVDGWVLAGDGWLLACCLNFWW
jgi:hypothetical protein